MDVLNDIIGTLSKEDSKEFRVFINRLKRKSNRKDLELFDILYGQNALSGKEIISKLYDDKNVVAYHALRKRLIKHITEFILIKRNREDPSSASTIMGMISLTWYLFEKNRDRSAWIILKKAEALADKSQQYELLNGIYYIQIRNAESEYAPEIHSIIKNKKKAQDLALQEDNANIANHLIKNELDRILKSGKNVDLEIIARDILKQYGLTDVVQKRPRLMFSIVSAIRSVIVAKKDYYTFEPYVIKNYQRLEKSKAFNQYNHYYKLSFLYMIAHVLYRNKKFKDSEKYLTKLHDNLFEYQNIHLDQFHTRYMMLLAAVKSLSNKNNEAIELHYQLLKQDKVKLTIPQVFNTHLNLAVYYYQKEDYSNAIKSLSAINHSDKWIIKKMGIEWGLKKQMIECIIHLDNENTDYFDSRIRGIERNFADMFTQKPYERVKIFLSFVKKINNNPQIANDPKFHDRVEQSFEFVETEFEDLQAIGFYAWLKAKMQKRKYYDVLLDLTHNVN
ncbi:MAG: hypothetical protein JKY33_00610 [Bacteroidia bacterium]|nr:hypothetical protein [Bacteroidia bacterium]